MGYPHENQQLNMKNLELITLIEVTNSIKKLKVDAANGPDSLGKNHLTSKHTNRGLAIFFNMCLMSGIKPDSWHVSRPKMILKDGKDSTVAFNCRPLTISSVVNRVFWRIIDMKLKLRKLISLNARQKGFILENG